MSLSAAGLPAGATSVFTPDAVSGTGPANLQIITSDTTPTGSYVITVAGTSGGLVHTMTVTLVVLTAVPDFRLTVSPGGSTVTRGSVAVFTVGVEFIGGFASPVRLSIAGAPPHSKVMFSPSRLTGSGTSSLTIEATKNTPTGAFTLTILGDGKTVSRTASVTLTVGN